MNKVRYWDNQSTRWFIRHFYLMFFQIILVAIFIIFFVNALRVIDVIITAEQTDIVEKLLLTQSVNLSIIVLLLLLNSFWMLFMFNSIIRLRSVLKDINFNIIRSRDKR
jgi:uncharacterized BrkB/YihY/UPF0761 family membrane protein